MSDMELAEIRPLKPSDGAGLYQVWGTINGAVVTAVMQFDGDPPDIMVEPILTDGVIGAQLRRSDTGEVIALECRYEAPPPRARLRESDNGDAVQDAIWESWGDDN